MRSLKLILSTIAVIAALSTSNAIAPAHCAGNCDAGGPAEIDCKWKATDYLYSCLIIGNTPAAECNRLANQYLLGCMRSWGCENFVLPSQPGGN